MLRKSTMKQNNLLRVYMKLEQHSYSGQMGFRNIEEGEGEGASSRWEWKDEENSSFQCWICSSDHSAIHTQQPCQCLSKHIYPHWTHFLVIHVLFFLNTAYQNGRIKWGKVWCNPFNSHVSACDLASCTHSPTHARSHITFFRSLI